MKRGRKPKHLAKEATPRRSNRSRKDTFKIKLLNATKKNLASAVLVSPFGDLDRNGNELEADFRMVPGEESPASLSDNDSSGPGILYEDSRSSKAMSCVSKGNVDAHLEDPIGLVQESPVTAVTPVIKRKRGRPRKYPVVLKDQLLPQGSLCAMLSPIKHSITDVSTDINSNVDFPGLTEPKPSVPQARQKNGFPVQKSKPKKTYNYEPILPPCKVCGAKASGYHFGAITCEACKVFFRRSLTRQTSYHCDNNGNCKILSNRRISCSFCRLKKCGELGMSRDGIQRGRYTVERKTECIRKVKELEILKQEKAADEGYVEDDSFDSSFSDTVCLTPKIDEETETFIREIVRADSECLMVDENQMNQLLEMQANYLEYLKLRDSVFGPMECLSSEEYHEVYKNTGIDLGNRRQKFSKCVFSFVHKITKFIEFAKSLPEFLKLSMVDQITLLREGMLDWVLLSGFEMFNSEELVFTCSSCHHTWSRDEFDAIKDKSFFFQSFIATAALKRLRFRKDELAILKALVIFSPDGSEGQVTDRTFIENYQQKLADCLGAILRKNRPHLTERQMAVLFGRIVMSLTEVRDASIRYKQLMDECLQHFPDVEYPDLFVEILGDELKVKLDTARAACISQNASLHTSTKLSTSSCESSLSIDSRMSSELTGDEASIWPQEPVVIQPTYADHYSSSFISNPDSSLISNFVDSPMDYDLPTFDDPGDSGTDRVLLLAQL